jgi:uncharacterized membrane protein
MKLALLCLVCALFPLTHMVMSHGIIREKMIGALGTWPFRGVYSLVSLLTLGAAVELFRHNVHLGPVLWDLPRWLELVVALPLMLLAFELLFLSLATPSPASMMPARPEARGVLRITRHPMNMAFACFGLAHMIANGALGDLAFFGAFFVLGLFGPMHQDRRLARDRGTAFRDFQKDTSGLPFVAILLRRNRLELAELSFPLLVLGAAAFAALVFFHGRLFDVGLF